MNQSDELIHFLEDQEKIILYSTKKAWTILIVDDDPDVHQVTQFAMKGTTIFEKELEFLHAYSAQEGIKILRERQDINIILLDVIMETPDAGLRMVRTIREELGMWDIRIILRTGQPGQVPEVETITRYDINDYKTKSELTRSRLLTTIIAAIRSWQQLMNIEAGRQGLEKIIHASNQLMVEQGLEEFAEGVITQLAGFLSLPPEGVFCVEDAGPANAKKGVDLKECRIIAAAGRYREFINKNISEIKDKNILRDIKEAFLTETSIIQPNSLTLFFDEPSSHRRFASWIESGKPILKMDHQLLEIFCKNISLCAQNIELVDRLKRQAWEDPLLGLPNLAALNQQLLHVKKEANGCPCLLAIMDIDQFGQINDYFGHEYGDQLLKAMTLHLQNSLSSDVFLSRLGADVFGLVGPDHVFDRTVLEKLTEAPLSIQNGKHNVTCCVGFAYLKDESNAINALKNASIALKRAKAEGLGHIVEYNENIGSKSRSHNRLLQDLRKAFKENQLFLVFQPQFLIEGRKLCGFEALLRWRSPGGDFISPDVFIPLAEQGGLMSSLGLWVLRSALHALRILWDEGFTGYRMAVNISASQLRNPDFLSQLDTVLEESNIMPSFLELEITESVAVIGIEGVVRLLGAIRNRGISLAIDDFGTGYSSLSSVDRWPIDRLKIDKSFIRHLEKGTGDTRIVDLVIPLAKRLSLKTLAEGVETEAQLEFLHSLGCEEMQGYLLGKPMDLTTLKEWLKDRKILH